MISEEKKQFRATKQWKDFRKEILQSQKKDLITGSKLCNNAHIHHMDTENYTDLTMEKFVALNTKSHRTIEFIYSAKDGWQNAVTQIIEICKHMDYWKAAKN